MNAVLTLPQKIEMYAKLTDVDADALLVWVTEGHGDDTVGYAFLQWETDRFDYERPFADEDIAAEDARIARAEGAMG